MTRNQDIREAMRHNGVRQWQLADKLGISEFTLCRHLRRELNEEQKALAMEAIGKIRAEEVLTRLEEEGETHGQV